jgi:hypothetical protein
MTRKVEYAFNNADLGKVRIDAHKRYAERIPPGEYEEDFDPLHAALSYLSTWAFDAYPTATITLDPESGELGGRYWNADGTLGYYICGVHHGARYSFHS